MASELADLTSRSEVVAGIEEVREQLVGLRKQASASKSPNGSADVLRGLLDAARQLEHLTKVRLAGIDDGLAEIEQLQRTEQAKLNEMQEATLAQAETLMQAEAELKKLEMKQSELRSSVNETISALQQLEAEQRQAEAERDQEEARRRRLAEDQEEEARIRLASRRAEAADEVARLSQEIRALGVDGIGRFSRRDSAKRRLLSIAERTRQVAVSLRQP